MAIYYLSYFRYFSFVIVSLQGACISLKTGSVNLYYAGEGESTVGTLRFYTVCLHAV